MRLSKRDFLKALGVGGGFLAGADAASMERVGLPAGQFDRPVGDVCEQFTEQPIEVDRRIALIQSAKSSYFDVIDDIIYDRVVFPAGAEIPQNIRLFSSPLGSRCPYDGQLKDHGRTNMDQSCMLSAPQSFWCRRIRHAFRPMSAHDIDLTHGWDWTLWLGQKRHAGGPMALDRGTFSRMSAFLRREVPSVRASMEFPGTKGLWFPATMCFNVELGTQSRTWSSSRYDEPIKQIAADSKGKGIDFIFAMEGIRWRGVQ